jgi:hypothetical protein
MMRRFGTRRFSATLMRSESRRPVDSICVMLPAVETGRTPLIGALTLIDRSVSLPRVHM